MRTLVTALFGVVALAGSAFASNIALDPAAGGIASVYNVSNELFFMGTTYHGSNALDGNFCPASPCPGGPATSTSWVAQGATSSADPLPYLLVNLGQLFSVDSITVDGVGNPGLTSSFDIFVGTLNALLAIETADVNGSYVPTCPGGQGYCAEPLQVLNNPDGAAWAQTGSVSPSVPIQYVLYISTNSTTTGACPGGVCFPGAASFSTGGVPTSGQDDASMNELVVNDPVVPEPTTLGLVGFSILALGYATRRFRQ